MAATSVKNCSFLSTVCDTGIEDGLKVVADLPGGTTMAKILLIS